MKFTLQDKVMFALCACWFAFFFMIMSTMIVDESTPAKYLFRTFLLTFSVPLICIWLTGTLGRVRVWRNESRSK